MDPAQEMQDEDTCSTRNSNSAEEAVEGYVFVFMPKYLTRFLILTAALSALLCAPVDTISCDIVQSNWQQCHAVEAKMQDQITLIITILIFTCYYFFFPAPSLHPPLAEYRFFQFELLPMEVFCNVLANLDWASLQAAGQVNGYVGHWGMGVVLRGWASSSATFFLC